MLATLRGIYVGLVLGFVEECYFVLHCNGITVAGVRKCERGMSGWID